MQRIVRYVFLGLVLTTLILSTTSSLSGFNVEQKTIENNVKRTMVNGAELAVTTDNGVYDPGELVTIFLTNIGLRMLFRFMLIIEKNRKTNNIKIPNEVIFEDLNSILNDKIVLDIRSSYGEGGASNTSKYICNLLKEKRRSRYKLLETDMRRLKKKV